MISQALSREISRHLKDDVFCRLANSPIAGVGVFAVRTIPKGARLFPVSTRQAFIAVDTYRRLTPGVRKLVRALAIRTDGGFLLYKTDFNRIDLGMFVNHSRQPNVDLVVIGRVEYVCALRRIRVGEELTRDYRLDESGKEVWH